MARAVWSISIPWTMYRPGLNMHCSVPLCNVAYRSQSANEISRIWGVDGTDAKPSAAGLSLRRNLCFQSALFLCYVESLLKRPGRSRGGRIAGAPVRFATEGGEPDCDFAVGRSGNLRHGRAAPHYPAA